MLFLMVKVDSTKTGWPLERQHCRSMRCHGGLWKFPGFQRLSLGWIENEEGQTRCLENMEKFVAFLGGQPEKPAVLGRGEHLVDGN